MGHEKYKLRERITNRPTYLSQQPLSIYLPLILSRKGCNCFLSGLSLFDNYPQLIPGARNLVYYYILIYSESKICSII